VAASDLVSAACVLSWTDNARQDDLWFEKGDLLIAQCRYHYRR